MVLGPGFYCRGTFMEYVVEPRRKPDPSSLPCQVNLHQQIFLQCEFVEKWGLPTGYFSYCPFKQPYWGYAPF